MRRQDFFTDSICLCEAKEWRTRNAIARASCSMPNCGEGRLNGISRSQVLPVFGGNVIDGKQPITVFCQLLRRLRILGRISVNKAVKGRERFFAGDGLPDIPQASFGPTMLRLGQSAEYEYIPSLVKPAALVSSLSEPFGLCCPLPHRRPRQVDCFVGLVPSDPSRVRSGRPSTRGNHRLSPRVLSFNPASRR